MRYNTISNNGIGIKITDISSSSDGNIKFNNFINNSVNVMLSDDNDFSNGFYNYWGTDENATVSEIASTINDVCNGDYDGMTKYTFL